MNLLKSTALILTALILVAAKTGYALDSRVILTIDSNVEDKWYKTKSETVPQFTLSSQVVKKQLFSVLVFFTGYKPGKENRVNLIYDIEILAPDKKSYFKAENIRAYDEAVQSDKLVLMCKDYAKVCFEPEDQFGEYTVIIKSKDTVNSTTSEAKAVIRLSEYRKNIYFENPDKVSEWIDSYYKSPTPEKAIDGFIFCCKNDIFRKNAVPPVYSFFIEIFNSNQYLIPLMIEEYKSTDLKIRIFILYLFAHLDYNFDSFIKELPDDEKDIYLSATKNRLPDSYGTITDASQLDMLWGKTLASGKYAAVRKIVDTLEYKKFEGSDSMKFLIYGAAKWSLRSNCSQHPLVKDYCRYMLEKEQLTATVRSELTEILSEK